MPRPHNAKPRCQTGFCGTGSTCLVVSGSVFLVRGKFTCPWRDHVKIKKFSSDCGSLLNRVHPWASEHARALLRKRCPCGGQDCMLCRCLVRRTESWLFSKPLCAQKQEEKVGHVAIRSFIQFFLHFNWSSCSSVNSLLRSKTTDWPTEHFRMWYLNYDGKFSYRFLSFRVTAPHIYIYTYISTVYTNL